MTDMPSRIFVAGHRGMVGAAIVRALERAGLPQPMVRTHAELPLDDRSATRAFFQAERPEWVFLAAAKVGGILANQEFGGDFIRMNLEIQTNVIHEAYAAGATKLLFLGSSCIYPREAEQPMREDSLLTGPLEPTNLPYAVAKIAGVAMCDAYRKQFGFDAFTVMPSNVYGIGDNFDPTSSHLVAGMMRRMHEARLADAPSVTVWGTGKPQRELVFADDLGDACVHLMRHWERGGLVNAGSSEEVSVLELAGLIADVVGYRGAIEFDRSKPDGTPRKIMDNRLLGESGFKTSTALRSGLEQMYAWWQEGQSSAERS
ncbi:GDP-L-fucose synthase family protein [Sphingomonas kyeonggiensis]|uniref:GDP-L-fucose synthase n=1 Tax=Sphingomonas kyeonggiensis TaxID=1268553 RepID=A0A7W6JUR5_9SPHN|nr:GDP-L-fucose synthase [Sphingomonas kyeonggiensis]MBB4099942.1 GDP-L-fucose synthase [Sphingomonas kyeonggiensis]